MQICIVFLLVALGGGLYGLHTSICQKREKEAYKNGYIQVQTDEKTRLKAVEQLETKCHQLERERDAAVSELIGTCQVCRWEETEKCASCHFNTDAWNAHESHWEWRGVRIQQDDGTDGSVSAG